MAKQEPALEFVSAKDVKVRPVKWLWPFLIPKGKITLLQGNPGDGKSTFMLTLAAYMTRGDPLPFTDYEEPPAPIKVIYQSTEDDYDETVVLLSKLSRAPKLEVKINTSELDLTEAEAKATYDEIRDYVKETTGLHVPNLYIAQTKRKLGLDLRENFNLPKCDNPKKLKCPPEKEKAIIAALKHFKMIS